MSSPALLSSARPGGQQHGAERAAQHVLRQRVARCVPIQTPGIEPIRIVPASP